MATFFTVLCNISQLLQLTSLKEKQIIRRMGEFVALGVRAVEFAVPQDDRKRCKRDYLIF